MIFETPTAGEGRALTTLREALPALVERLDHASVDEVERLLKTRQVKAESFVDELVDPPIFLVDQLRLWAGLVQCLEDVQGQWFSQRERFVTFSTRYFNQPTGRARRGVMLQYLRENVDSEREFRRDQKALDDYLDFDVLTERHRRDIGDLVGHIRVILHALARLGADMLARFAAEEDAVLVAAQCLRSLEPNERLGCYLFGEDHPDLMVPALQAMHPPVALLLGHAPMMVRADWVRRLVLVTNSDEQSSWAQIAALGILVHDHESSVELVESRLRHRRDHPDDWHVRAHCARLLGEHAPERALEIFADGDTTSDAVAMAMADTLGELASPRSVEILETMALAKGESRPKVRAQALLSAVRLVGWGGAIAQGAARVLVLGLRQEPEAWVIGCLHEEVDGLLDELGKLDGAGAARAAGLLRRVLGERLDVEPDAAVANRIARLRLHLAERMEGEDDFAADAKDLVGVLARLHTGESARLACDKWSEAVVMRAMARAAGEGFGLYARQRFGSWRIYRGEKRRVRLWRVLHEIRHPAPNKRQGYHHAHARVYPGWLRAHPEQLGELTPTAVPGERRQVGAEGGWGPYLPLVDDLLDAQMSRRPITLVTTVGVVRLQAPTNPLRRLWNFLVISWRYDRLDRQRLASIEGDDERQRSRYLARIEQTYRTRMDFERHLDDDPVPPATRALFAESSAAPRLESMSAPALAGEPAAPVAGESAPAVHDSMVALAVALFGQAWSAVDRMVGWAHRTAVRMMAEKSARMSDLAVVLMVVIAMQLGRLAMARWRIGRWRRSIPLCIGGWGTRGKSGTERLKAGLFHGLGYNVFVKTTGCEAMFIHAPRGDKAREVFIYRPYDKATIWEQRDMLRLGTRLDCDVFLWECMALSPRYVDLLQSQWMRDDLVTLTNAYPDHEDIQGPAGVDVAQTIAGFLPRRGQALTTEREMLPILKDEARKKHTELQVVGERAEYLLPDDVLERFPYNEHPRNIALVAAMAERLGIEREYAIFQMADNVVPDLGVLKKYPQVRLLGRDLELHRRQLRQRARRVHEQLDAHGPGQGRPGHRDQPAGDHGGQQPLRPHLALAGLRRHPGARHRRRPPRAHRHQPERAAKLPGRQPGQLPGRAAHLPRRRLGGRRRHGAQPAGPGVPKAAPHRLRAAGAGGFSGADGRRLRQ